MLPSSAACLPVVSLRLADEVSELEGGDMESKIAGRKKRVKIGYQVVTYGYIFFSALVLRNGVTPLTAYALSGPLLVAGVNHQL